MSECHTVLNDDRDTEAEDLAILPGAQLVVAAVDDQRHRIELRLAAVRRLAIERFDVRARRIARRAFAASQSTVGDGASDAGGAVGTPPVSTGNAATRDAMRR